MQGSAFDEAAFFRAIAAGGARALLIGRRALVVLGLPVLTADYDFWLHRDDIERFNDGLVPLGLHADRAADEARRRGRYVLENDERVDVLVASGVVLPSGQQLDFDAVWSRRRTVALAPGVTTVLPSLDDLIATKRIALRPKDVEDIRLLEILKSEEPRDE